MLRIRTILSLSALTFTLAACPAPEAEQIELREGNWSFTFDDVHMVGDCDEFEPGEVDDRPLRGVIAIDGDDATFEIDGLTLEGDYVDNLLDVEGGLSFGENPHEDDVGGDTGDGEDVMTLRLKANAKSPILLEGELTVTYDLLGMECTASATALGRHMGKPGDDNGED